MGLVPPLPGYLEAAREITTPARRASRLRRGDLGVPRWPPGARRSSTASRPDLTMLGKILGGGLPVGAYGGPRDLMEQVAPSGPVYQAGTLSGNPLAMAAGIAMLREIARRPPYARAGAQGRPPRGAAAGEAIARERPRTARLTRRASDRSDALLRARTGDRLRRGEALGHRALRGLLPRAAGARRLSAAGAVRGLVPFDRARARPTFGGPRASRGRPSTRHSRSPS